MEDAGDIPGLRQMLISVCIPTYRRPALLQEAIQSAIQHQHRPIEILVGDDSPTNGAEAIVASVEGMREVQCRYLWNRPSLGQANNINRLYREARGEYSILLHDDDRLLPGAIDVFVKCCIRNPDVDAVYGKQIVITADGTPLLKDSETLNGDYRRIDECEGSVLSPIEAGLLQQFPNDGFLIRTELARQVPLQTRELIGEMCDFDFGVRLGLVAKRFYFVNQFTAEYRITGVQLSANVKYEHLFQMVEEYPVPHQSEWARAIALSRLAPQAILEYVATGKRTKALRVYMSPHHRLVRRLSPGGLRRLGVILFGRAA
jgi:glycosyltransferase involved in cell wall biosynthesis